MTMWCSKCRALPDRVRLAGQQVVALHAGLVGFEDGEQVPASVGPVSLTRDHVPDAGVRLAVGQLRLAVRNRLLLEVWIPERDRLASLPVGGAELERGV